MKKLWVFWGLSLVIVVGAIALIMAGDFRMTEETRVMKIRTASSALEAANAISESLGNELKETPIWLFGIFPEDQFGGEILVQFLKNSPASLAFDEIWLDGPWTDWLVEGPDTAPVIRSLYLRKNEELVRRELLAQNQQKKRILIVSSPIDVNSTFEQSPTWKILEMGDLNFKSLSFSEFPRLRAHEPAMKVPCVLSHSDKDGTGAFGCLVLNLARLNYRKRFETGQRVMLLERVSKRDFIFLSDLEPALP